MTQESKIEFEKLCGERPDDSDLGEVWDVYYEIWNKSEARMQIKIDALEKQLKDKS